MYPQFYENCLNPLILRSDTHISQAAAPANYKLSTSDGFLN